jgi:hypothetical protein
MLQQQKPIVMKRTLLLPVLFLFMVLQSAYAYQETSRLQISSYDNAPILLVVDGVQYGPFSNRQKITNLAPGYHQIKVVASYKRPYQRIATTYVIFHDRVNVLDGFATDAVIQPGNVMQIVQQVALYQPVVKNPGWCGTSPVTEQFHPVPVGPVAMCQVEFQDFLYSVQSKSFESTKLTIAKQVIVQNYFTSAQIRQLMGVFDFESGKLEIAKFAYNNVVDQQRYYTVNDAFSFESSIYELDRYLHS